MGESRKTNENFLTQKLKSALWIASPAEEAKLARSKLCSDAAVIEGFKAAAVGCVAAAVPTLLAVRKIPWAKAYINAPGQAFIISSATVASFVITTDKSMIKCAEKNSQLARSMKSA